MNIEPFRAAHVRAVAGLHTRYMTGLLYALGGPATRAYYAGCARSPRAVGFVAVENGVVRGFVIGSLQPRALKLDAMIANPIRFVVGAGLGVMLRPTNSLYLLEAFRSTAGTHDAGGPELTYIAVAPEARKTGVGRQLVDAFSAAMRQAGAGAYELSVDVGNGAADAFYRRLGFTQVGTYREFGVDHKRYRLDLTR